MTLLVVVETGTYTYITEHVKHPVHYPKNVIHIWQQLVLVQVQVLVLVLDLSGPTLLRFGLETFFGPDSVHV